MEVVIFIFIFRGGPRRVAFIKKIVYAFHHSPSKSAAALIAPMSPHVHPTFGTSAHASTPWCFAASRAARSKNALVTRKNASRGISLRSAGRSHGSPYLSARVSLRAESVRRSTGPVSEGPATSQERVVFW